MLNHFKQVLAGLYNFKKYCNILPISFTDEVEKSN